MCQSTLETSLVEMWLKFLSFALCLTFSFGFIQEITFYTELGAGGNAFRFRTKEPNLAAHQFFLTDVKSLCYKGL